MHDSQCTIIFDGKTERHKNIKIFSVSLCFYVFLSKGLGVVASYDRTWDPTEGRLVEGDFLGYAALADDV